MKSKLWASFTLSSRTGKENAPPAAVPKKESPPPVPIDEQVIPAVAAAAAAANEQPPPIEVINPQKTEYSPIFYGSQFAVVL